METKDSNGNILSNGDSVHLVKDLKVKGSSATLKRGVKIKNIRLAPQAFTLQSPRPPSSAGLMVPLQPGRICHCPCLPDLP